MELLLVASGFFKILRERKREREREKEKKTRSEETEK